MNPYGNLDNQISIYRTNKEDNQSIFIDELEEVLRKLIFYFQNNWNTNYIKNEENSKDEFANLFLKLKNALFYVYKRDSDDVRILIEIKLAQEKLLSVASSNRDELTQSPHFMKFYDLLTECTQFILEKNKFSSHSTTIIPIGISLSLLICGRYFRGPSFYSSWISYFSMSTCIGNCGLFIFNKTKQLKMFLYKQNIIDKCENLLNSHQQSFN